MLLDFSDNPAAKEHNDRVKKAFLTTDNLGQFIGGTIEDRTQLMMEFLDKMEQIDYNALFNASDEQVVEQFPKLFSLYVLAVEGGDKILENNRNEKHPKSDYFSLSPEYEEKLKWYKNEYQTLMSDLKARFDYIMDPNYALIHAERIAAPDLNHRPVSAYNDNSKSIVQRTAGMAEEALDLTAYIDILSNCYNLRNLAWDDKVNHFAREHGLDPNRVEIVKADGTVIPPTELEGVKMFQLRDQQSGKSVTVQSDGFNLTQFKPQKTLTSMKNDVAPLIKAMEDADPWYIRMFSGSQEYDDMKKQMQAVKEAMDQLSRHAPEEQYKLMSNMLNDLMQKSNAYLDKKGIMDENTKDSERARIMAARGIKEFAENSILMLDAERQQWLKRDAEHQAIADENNDGMSKNLDEEINFGKVREITKNSRAWVPVKNETEAQQVQFNKNVLVYYTGKLDYGDPMEDLGFEIARSMDNEYKLPENPVALVAKMVTFDLVMRERVSNKGAIGGPIEKKYLENPEMFCQKLEQNKTLKGVTEDMNVAEFRRFVNAAVGAEGVQQLTSKMLQELQHQNPQEDLQLQQNVPELSKNGPMMNG
jgi:hypothetical protein